MKPSNIVLILTDQQRADFLAAEGFPHDTMPFVESLGRRGVRFCRAYTPNPTCCPARCAMLTGRYPKATRVRDNGGVQNILHPGDLPSTLGDLGYSTFLAGKNHSYLRPDDLDGYSDYHHTGCHGSARNETEAAFDQWLQSLDHRVSLEPTPFPLEAQLPYRIVRDALEFIDDRDHSRPFFLWMSFPEPHNPYQVPQPYFSLFPELEIPPPVASPDDGSKKGPLWRWLQRLISEKRPGYQDEWRRYRANYCGMLRMIDDQIRRFHEGLAIRGLDRDTLFIFTSDHGDYAADYGLQRKGVGLPECLVRVPLIACGPGIHSRVSPVEACVSLSDLFPTLCDAVEAPIPYGVQGRSLWPMLTGGPYDPTTFRSAYAEVGFGGAFYGENERPPLHFSYEGASFDELNTVTQSGLLKMVRMGSWKLTYDRDGRGGLYHLDADPMELENLWDIPGAASARALLTEELLLWSIRTEDDLPTGKYTPKSLHKNSRNIFQC